MTPEEAAMKIERELLKDVPVSQSWGQWTWDTIKQSIRNNGNGVVGSQLILLLALTGFPQGVHLLLQKGADIETKSSDGRPALSFAASSGKEGMIRLLLEKGSNINAQDNLGVTPLMRTATFGDLATVRLMVRERCRCQLD